jgi:hypothetical protein
MTDIHEQLVQQQQDVAGNRHLDTEQSVFDKTWDQLTTQELKIEVNRVVGGCLDGTD